MNIQTYNYARVASAVPTLKVGDPEYNVEQMKILIDDAINKKCDIITFPELSITGYSCGDLFNQTLLLETSKKKLQEITNEYKHSNIIIIAGLPLEYNNKLYNCAAVIFNGEILGIVPKSYIPNYNEFYENRWFSSGKGISEYINLFGELIRFSDKLIFCNQFINLNFAIEICEDAWVPHSPSIDHCVNGAHLILNLSASNELIGKEEYRRNLVKQNSASCISAYVYCSAGINESTTDIVFSGHSIIAENGSILKEDIYNLNNSLIFSDIDLEIIKNDRKRMSSYPNGHDSNYIYKYFNNDNSDKNVKLERNINSYPFVPKNKNERINRCDKILKLQSLGLAQRLKTSNINKVVLGISGGLDSTLALLVCCETMKILNLPQTNIIGITMPGFGTTNKTYDNACLLMKQLGISIKEISIKAACEQHFKDINHASNIYDVTYENSQARERTQILMDVANQENALVIGTGDLSELALGWCTYNGDHMSMYSVNCSVPKTLVRYIVETYTDKLKDLEVSKTLYEILNTAVSPELLPTNSGEIEQVTEDIIGPYEIHDFILYNMIRFGFSPKKIYQLLLIAFEKYDSDALKKYLGIFYKRFFSQQFKRSALPDGPKVGSISLSPRGDWRMPSDASANIWLDQIEFLK